VEVSIRPTAACHTAGSVMVMTIGEITGTKVLTVAVSFDVNVLLVVIYWLVLIY